MAEQAYFSQFHRTFTPNPQAKALDNFYDLAASQGWRDGSKKYRSQKSLYMQALAQNHITSLENGTAAEKLARLQDLCWELRIAPVPVSITQCKKALQTRHVCIIDLIDHRRLGTQIPIYRSQRALREHVKSTRHFFPKEQAKGNGDGVLRVLLRTINV